MIRLVLLSFSLLFGFIACNEKPNLPIIGPREVITLEDGSKDTLYHSIPEFSFLDQDSQYVSLENLKGKYVVADFFFTTCPSICPIMKSQMLRVYEEYGGRDDFIIVSHSIDPEHDTVAVLREYAGRLGVPSDNWRFLTGDLEDILELAQKGYLVSAAEDSTAPGGFIHSGAFILLDQQQRIRGYYDGTKELQVDLLIKDLNGLLSAES